MSFLIFIPCRRPTWVVPNHEQPITVFHHGSYSDVDDSSPSQPKLETVITSSSLPSLSLVVISFVAEVVNPLSRLPSSSSQVNIHIVADAILIPFVALTNSDATMGSSLLTRIRRARYLGSRPVVPVTTSLRDKELVNDVPGDSVIARLPTEILQKIMGSMDAQTLLSFIQTSKRVHLAYKGASYLICLETIASTVGSDLLPIAVSCFMARRLDLFSKPINHNNKELVFSLATNFIRKFVSYQAMERTIPHTYFSLNLALCLQSFHQEVVEVMANMYLNPLQRKSGTCFIEYILEEKTRLSKSLYLFELVHLLIVPVASYNDRRLRKNIISTFWRKFTLCDHAQMRYVVETFLCQRVKGVAEKYSRHFAAIGDETFHKLYRNYGPNAPPPTHLWCPCHDATVCDWKRVSSCICDEEAMMVVFANGIQGLRDIDTRMNKYIDVRVTNDIKTGLKGIHGVGETLRGTVNEAADQALDTNVKHPASQESQLKHQGTAAKGKAEVDGADSMLARHEAKHGGNAAQMSQPIEGNHAFRG
ncbi:hypothetical protein E8E14_001524 [Neopestalotiopsis sp. 37M]|nr:hypothetical protein E8E14_001524 [Neopestalotiopsis sp. 37M]